MKELITHDEWYALCNQRDALALLLLEVRPMIESYRRKHERAYKAAERRFHTEYMENNAEVVGKCDRILNTLDSLLGITADKEQPGLSP